MSHIRRFIERNKKNTVNDNKSVFIGDDHSEEFWQYNHDTFRDFKPDFLLLEVIGLHRYLTPKERDRGRKSYVYMDNKNQPGYNSDAFKLAEDLNIPMIGIDTWDYPYRFDDGLDYSKELSSKDLDKSHRIREARMAKVAKEFLPKGKVLLIVGAEHLRKESELAKMSNNNDIAVKFFKM